MKTLTILSLVLVTVLGSCKKDDDGPTFTSAEGDWTYTTPDSKISVDFTLVKTGTTWSATNEVIRVDGTKANAVIQTSNLNPPSIDEIRINANDTKITYPYLIDFVNATVSADFSEIKVPGATYTWPIDKTNQLTDITITRR